jgi:hypothetical protein
MKKIFFLLLTTVSVHVVAQKKVLDHSVYDSWQSLGERGISKNGLFIFFFY